MSCRGFAEANGSQESARPNVLFIIVDDMRDWVGYLGGYAGTAHTPNIDKLAARGVGFTNAHCPSPLCNPSRTAVMSGRMPSSTGVYDNGQWWPPNHPDLQTIPSYFRRQGYEVVGAGKIFHHTAGSNPPVLWDAFRHLYFSESPWFRGSRLNYPWSVVTPKPAGFPYSHITGLGGEFDWGVLPLDRKNYDDSQVVDYALDFLARPKTGPFFLACGIFRPHVPWYTPQEFVDLYPLDSIVLPEVKQDDLDDVPPIGREWASHGRQAGQKILDAGAWKKAVQAYLASISFADYQVGRLLDQLAASPSASNTIVVLWSDHGWHLGTKGGHWHKSTLWEEATRVPFVIAAPGKSAAGVPCARPVSLVDIFPTLVSLCELPKVDGLDGTDLSPLLRDPNSEWTQPAVIEFMEGNAAVRDQQYRLIRYRDGTEELYDLLADPHEWDNRAADPKLSGVKTQLARSLPKSWARPVPAKGAFIFDPRDYSWRARSTGVVVSGAGPKAAMPVFQGEPWSVKKAGSKSAGAQSP